MSSDSDNITLLVIVGFIVISILSAIGAKIGVDWMTVLRMIINLGVITAGAWYLSLMLPLKAHWPILIPAYFIVLFPALDYRGKTYDAWYGQSFWMMTFFTILCIIAAVMTYKLRRKYHIR